MTDGNEIPYTTIISEIGRYDSQSNVTEHRVWKILYKMNSFREYL